MSLAPLSPQQSEVASMRRTRKPIRDVLPGNWHLNRILKDAQEVQRKQEVALLERKVERLVLKWYAFGGCTYEEISHRLGGMVESDMFRSPDQVKYIIENWKRE